MRHSVEIIKGLTKHPLGLNDVKLVLKIPNLVNNTHLELFNQQQNKRQNSFSHG
jgi:hypothetical protein